jgi:hypothetical protein
MQTEGGKRRIVKNGLSCTFMIYMMSVFFALIYFEYQYTREHDGFFNNLTLGTIVPAAKSVVWPYFAWSEHGEGIRREQARQYFRAISASGTKHPSIDVLMAAATARAEERTKNLGKEAGLRSLIESFKEVAKLVRADVEKAASVNPPPHLVEFHKQSTADARQLVDIVDRMVKAMEAQDQERVDDLRKQLETAGRLAVEQMIRQAKESGVELD